MIYLKQDKKTLIDEIENLSDNSFIRMIASYNYPTFIQDKTYLTDTIKINIEDALYKYNLEKFLEVLFSYR
jgi:hypothetical protein